MYVNLKSSDSINFRVYTLNLYVISYAERLIGVGPLNYRYQKILQIWCNIYKSLEQNFKYERLRH